MLLACYSHIVTNRCEVVGSCCWPVYSYVGTSRCEVVGPCCFPTNHILLCAGLVLTYLLENVRLLGYVAGQLLTY